MKVLKFGGSSLENPGRIEGVLHIIRKARLRGPIAVVVSAMGGVTDELTLAAREAARGRDTYLGRCDRLEQRHKMVVEALSPPDEKLVLRAEVATAFQDLRNLFRGSSMVRECTPRTLDSILSYGERLSALLVGSSLRGAGTPAQVCDARDLLLTDNRFGNARVLVEESEGRIRQHFEDLSEVQIITGFIGATSEGDTTTIGRGGSDYTAALVAGALGASELEIWTDVDGVMSADPRVVRKAFPIPSLSYAELMELSHFGAKVVYPPTIHPARRHHIPLYIRNSLDPSSPGTRVDEGNDSGGPGIRGITSIGRVAMLRLEGDGMVGVPGIAMRLFGALAQKHINIILISQASSEHSICFVVEPQAVAPARESIAREFALELQAGLIDDLVVEEDTSVIAVVGAKMRQHPGIAGRVFGVLGHQGINVRAISQGSSELNISFVTARPDRSRAITAIHEAFFSDSETQPIVVYLAGTGSVGSELLEQIRVQSELLARTESLQLCVEGIAGRQRHLLVSGGIDVSSWRKQLKKSGSGGDAESLVSEIMNRAPDRATFVDCTASEAIPRFYPDLLRHGIAVVASNKRAFSGALAAYRELQQCARESGVQLLYETTVGAGLPILQTLREMVRTGDLVARIDGAFSGTLSYIFRQMAKGSTFSQALAEAHRKKLTEPDPREDLAGKDVARKLLIVAREAGFSLEPEDVEVGSLLPESKWSSMSLADFWKVASHLDEFYEFKQSEAEKAGLRLCYLARVDESCARVGLEAIEPTHPCAELEGSDNLIAIHSSRYHHTPLVIQGPGAGPQVTAAGVFADILRATLRMR